MEKDICREQICLSEGKEKGAVLFNITFIEISYPQVTEKKVITYFSSQQTDGSSGLSSVHT